MRATGWLRRNAVEVLWGLFAVANWAAMIAWPAWETIPFHFVWISLTIVYGFRVWRPGVTGLILSTVILATGASILSDAFRGIQLWGELFEVPLMSAMFLAMVWHARRRQAAMRQVEAVADTRASLLEQQERFLHDASHELRTPVTIARGHLELLSRDLPDAPELTVALDELQRMERIVDRLLLLAKAEQPDFVVLRDVQIDRFLEDVFMRWSEVAPRAWRLEVDVQGVARVDPEALRSALDALVENAVKYTELRGAITMRALAVGGEIVLEVVDDGSGIPDEAIATVFDRFARADDARTRARGGVGLGLAIVSAIARAHGGHCTVERRDGHTVFALVLPVGGELEARPAQEPVPAGLVS
ncbi:MAG: HAMP domain-containing histidine kinase [Acidobacteriota bacterium]|nr:HAMP domain-containing histidine kinase [Acidobacteriota bacterium]MDE3190360.1 HAMP domain-containing histidine kinase [Acidobacteriota bacterium]